MELFLKFSNVHNCKSSVLLPEVIAPPLSNRRDDLFLPPATLPKYGAVDVFQWILQSLGSYFVYHLRKAEII